jgi:hypothetical protein
MLDVLQAPLFQMRLQLNSQAFRQKRHAIRAALATPDHDLPPGKIQIF